jgi:Cys-tRNA synthase (O-phospho-L-seryl-tRNA:Cys-tRNA synthase)
MMQCASCLSGDQVVDEISAHYEAYAVAAEAGKLADGVSKVGLTDAAGADEYAVSLFADEVADWSRRIDWRRA